MSAHAQLPKATDALAAMEARLRLAVVGLSIAAVAAAWLVWRAAAELPYLGLAAAPVAGSPDVSAIRFVELAMKPPPHEVRVDLEIEPLDAAPIAAAQESRAEGRETVPPASARSLGAGVWPIQEAVAREFAAADPAAMHSAIEGTSPAAVDLPADAAPFGRDSASSPAPTAEAAPDPEEAPAAQRGETETATMTPAVGPPDTADLPAQAAEAAPEPVGDAAAEPQAQADAAEGAAEVESAAPMEAAPSPSDLADSAQPAAPSVEPAAEAADQASATSEAVAGASDGSVETESAAPTARPNDPAASMQPAALDATSAQAPATDAAASPQIEASASEGVPEEESGEAMATSVAPSGPAAAAQPAALDASAQAPGKNAPADPRIEPGVSQEASEAEGGAGSTDLVEPAQTTAPEAEPAQDPVEEASAGPQGEAGASMGSAETESAAIASPAGAPAVFVESAPPPAKAAEPEAQARVAPEPRAEEADRTSSDEAASLAAPAAGAGSSQSDLQIQETAPPAGEEAAVPRAPTLTQAQIESYLRRGDERLETGDIAAARLLYERAAAAGDARAMLALARTFDAQALKAWGVVGLAPEEERARYWYRKANAAREAATR